MTLAEVAKKLKENDNFYILTHKYPDGDTLGSSFALSLALKQMNKKVKVLLAGSMPCKYKSIFNKEEVDTSIDFDCKYIISIDVADTPLLGDLQIYKDDVDLCIDHHVSNSNYAKNSYIDSSAAATAEIIYELLKIFNINLSKNIAKYIYAGISTDTGCFKYSNVTSRTHLIASELLKTGIDHANINHLALEVNSKSQIKLKKMVLETLAFWENDKIACIHITKSMLNKAGVSENDIDGFSSIPRNIDGVILGIMFIEKENNTVKVSMRSNDLIDVSKICKEFGGGGHKCAAGCTLVGQLLEVKKEVLNFCKKRINELL